MPLKFSSTAQLEQWNYGIYSSKLKIQNLELSGQVTPEMMAELAKRAKSAIAEGKQTITDYNHSLEKLKLASPQPNQLPWGF